MSWRRQFDDWMPDRNREAAGGNGAHPETASGDVSSDPHTESEDQSADDGSTGERDATDLLGRVEVLERENERLRQQYAYARRRSYRRTAQGLAAIGIVALAGGFLFSNAQTVLLSLGGIGVFAAVLTYFLTPDRFISAGVGERVYAALAANHEEMQDELGLVDVREYYPLDDGVRLFVPQHEEHGRPSDEDLSSLFVVADEGRGVSLTPSGAHLFDEFERARSMPSGESPGALVQQLIDALVEALELVESAESDVDPDDGRAVVDVTGAAYGAPDSFDNPIASFLAVGLVRELDHPVVAETLAGEEDGELTVLCRWGDEESTIADERTDEVSEDQSTHSAR